MQTFPVRATPEVARVTSNRWGRVAMGKCFEFEDAFPPIQDVIEELCQRTGEATYRAIVEELIEHPQGSRIIELAVGRCPGRTKESMAGKMVQWLSQQYTEKGLGDFEKRFQRRKYKGTWAYSRR